MSLPSNYLQMTSTVTPDGELRMELVEKSMPEPKPGQIIVKVEATPINPSDHGVMFGWSNMAAASTSGTGVETSLTAPVPSQGMAVMKARMRLWAYSPSLLQVTANMPRASSARQSPSWVAACMPSTAP